ncbi:MAG: hypothetical protein Q4G60_14500 [bacterium]|nr:hypothetical protein [bacterium]
MKKKILAVVLTAAMSAMVLTACGGDKAAEAPVEEAAVEETADAGSDEMVSDETFATLQDNYATMTEAYNSVADLYSSDEVAADADIEATMNQAADVINQMGEITQDTLTEADAEQLNSAMVDILDGLSMIVDGMSAADAGSDEMVSDETFATLQDNYAATVEAYNAVAELYSADEIAADADIEATMTQAADVINQMGEITQDTLTEADAEQLNSAMGDILDGLSMIVDGMTAAE